MNSAGTRSIILCRFSVEFECPSAFVPLRTPHGPLSPNLTTLRSLPSSRGGLVPITGPIPLLESARESSPSFMTQSA
jgi:hypothetical protein